MHDHQATRLRFSALALSLLAALAACTLGQGATPPVGRTVTEIDDRIWVIHQSRSGDHWFGSNGNGVYRYDGRLLTHYTKADGLSGHHVRHIAEHEDGHVLVSTTDGVAKFDGEQWTELEIEASSDCANWRLDHDDLWIVADPGSGGPCRYDGEKLYRLELTKSPVEAAVRANHPNAGFALDGTYSVYKDRHGHVWFGTSNLGLCRYDGETLSWMYEESLTTTPSGGAFGIRSIYQDQAGDFWICNTRQRFAISSEVSRDGEFSVLDYKEKDGLPDAGTDAAKNFAYFLSVSEDDAGSLWFGCGSDGVWKYDGEGVTHYVVGDEAYVFDIFHDHEGTLWACTLEAGLHTLRGERFDRFALPETRK